MNICKNIKEKQCYLIFNKEKNGEGDMDCNYISSDYILPDGNKIELGEEKILAPEILFNNKLNFSEYQTFDEMVFNSISKADINIKNKLYNTVILTGGNVLFRGMEEKMKGNLEKRAPKHMEIKLRINNNPQISCWNGGNIISSLSSFRKMWVTKNDWTEKGKKIVQDKCI